MDCSFKAPPSVPRSHAFFETKRMCANPLAVFSEHMSELGDTYYYFFGGIKRVLVTSNPAVLRRILKENSDNYRKSEIQTRRMEHFLGHGLLTSHGAEWKGRRRMIQKGFTRATLAALADDMHASLEESIARLAESAASGLVDLSREMTAITFAMVSRSLFGASIEAAEVDQISNAIVQIQSLIVRQIVQPYLAGWFVASGELRRHERLRLQGDAILRRHIRERRAQPAGTDLLQILLGAVDPVTGNGMTDDEVLHESMQLLVAGHETSANALTWILYLLERNPEYLRRIREEFDAVLGRQRLRPEHLNDLKLAVQIVEESLRLYPPFWMVDRVAVREDRVGEIDIRAGQTIIAFLYGVHRSPDYWSDPSIFRPERITEDDRSTGRGFTFLPFGGGPRSCIGASYAMLQMLMVLSVVLRRFTYSISEGGAVEPGPMIILRQKKGTLTLVRGTSSPTEARSH
jgi:cytochrome P450